jgi:hypothetical protein
VPFLYAAGSRQRSLSWVGVPWVPLPYFTVSDLRLPFRRLLQLAGSAWRYSTPPPHGSCLEAQSYPLKIVLRLILLDLKSSLYSLGSAPRGNTVS